jgi:hypothetical protein
MKPIKPKDLIGIRNDTGMSAEAVAELLSGDNAVEVSYGDFHVRAERHMLDKARQEARSLASIERHVMMQLLDWELRRNLPRLRAGKFSRKRADAAVADVMLWHALKEIGE